MTNIPIQVRRSLEKKYLFFEQARELAIKAQSCVPQMRALGWDIIITEKGPVILEGNASWGWEMIQYANGRGLVDGNFGREVREIVG